MARITSSDPQAKAMAPTRNNKTVMIAEDDPFISRMYQIKLQSVGYSVSVQNNGRDAYESAKAHPPDLILLDLGLPELSGFEVLTALKNDNFDFAACPVIILTNSSQEKDREWAKQLGVDFLIKAEFTPAQVVEQINRKLGLDGRERTGGV